jgi:hypothetical protein
MAQTSESIRQIGTVFTGFPRAEEVTEYAATHVEEINRYLNAFDAMVRRFNARSERDAALVIMPAAAKLKKILHGNPLPTAEELASTRPGRFTSGRGILEAYVHMARGIADAKLIETHQEPLHEPQDRILAGTLNTNSLALAIAAALHMEERADKQRIFEMTGYEIAKDDVLVAIEQEVLYDHFSNIKQPDPEVELIFELFTSAPSPDEHGGVGWVPPQSLADFKQAYTDFS